MLNYDQFVNLYQQVRKELNLQSHEAIVLSKGAMLMHSLCETTNDIDLEVPADVFDQLVNSGQYELEELGTPIPMSLVKYHPDVSIGLLREQRTTIVNDVGCQTLAEVLAFKKMLNRDKDQDDIDLLECLVTEQSCTSKPDITAGVYKWDSKMLARMKSKTIEQARAEYEALLYEFNNS